MTYNPENLNLADPSSLDWALAWARFLLGDKTAPESWADAELTAILQATAHQATGGPWYRPHIAAGAMLEADPNRPASESLLSASVTHRDASSLARALRKQHAWIDDLIAAESGSRPASGLTLEVTW